jgi:hypothetical protein
MLTKEVKLPIENIEHLFTFSSIKRKLVHLVKKVKEPILNKENQRKMVLEL